MEFRRELANCGEKNRRHGIATHRSQAISRSIKKEPGDEAEGPESPGILTHLRRVWVRNWLCC
jgi:hypothetical protein